MKRGRKAIGVDMALSDKDTTTFIEYVIGNGSVTIAKIGTFRSVEIKPRTLYHNTGKRIVTTRAYKKLKYEPSSLIKTILNKK